jgi:hypothetical protein
LLGEGARIDARAEETFRRVNIADTDHNAGVHDRLLDWGAAALQSRGQSGSSKLSRQRLNAQVDQQWMLGGIAFDPEYRTKTPRIAQA